MTSNQDLIVTKKDSLPLSSNNNTKALYIVVTEDPTTKSKEKAFLSSRKDERAAAIEIAGYEVTNDQIARIENVKTVTDAIDIAKEKSQIQYLTLPWQRIIRIKNIVMNIK